MITITDNKIDEPRFVNDNGTYYGVLKGIKKGENSSGKAFVRFTFETDDGLISFKCYSGKLVFGYISTITGLFCKGAINEITDDDCKTIRDYAVDARFQIEIRDNKSNARYHSYYVTRMK